MTTDKLGLYNGALRKLAERKLASLKENRLPRRVLDDIWADNLIDAVLEMGNWQWATRALKLSPDPSISPPFGYKFAYPKPDDCINTMAISSDEYFTEPLTRFVDEAGVWYTDCNILYVKITSNLPAYGADFSKWSAAFIDFVEAYMAWKAGPRITGVSVSADTLLGRMEKALQAAQGVDGSDRPTVWPSRGSWNNARHGRFSLNRTYGEP